MQLLTVLAFVGLISLSIACSCLPLDTKTMSFFCTSDVVLQIKVNTERQVRKVAIGPATDGVEVYYGVEVQKIFKGNDRMIPNDKVYTNLDSASCGRDFTNGEEYIISASLTDGKLWSGLCGFSKTLTLLDENEKQFFDSGFKSVKC